MATELAESTDFGFQNFRHGRAPRRAPRMLPRRAICGSSDALDRGHDAGRHDADPHDADTNLDTNPDTNPDTNGSHGDGIDLSGFGGQSKGDRGPRPTPAHQVRAGRVSVRVAVPDRMLRMTEFGLRYVRDECHGDAWWRRVADQMASLVSANLPAGARSVDMAIDSEKLEVVLEYDSPGLRLAVCE